MARNNFTEAKNSLVGKSGNLTQIRIQVGELLCFRKIKDFDCRTWWYWNCFKPPNQCWFFQGCWACRGIRLESMGKPTKYKPLLGGGFKYFLFSPRKLGKIPILTNIFQMGWNHQLVSSSWNNFDPIRWFSGDFFGFDPIRVGGTNPFFADSQMYLFQRVEKTAS